MPEESFKLRRGLSNRKSSYRESTVFVKRALRHYFVSKFMVDNAEYQYVSYQYHFKEATYPKINIVFLILNVLNGWLLFYNKDSHVTSCLDRSNI